MKLLRFGDTTINIARAIRIDDGGTYITVDFVASDNPLLPLNVRFEGKDAAALRHWIRANAEDLTQLDEESIGDPLSGPKPYTSPR
jgi:hypothetical protein